jgi:high-affinity nickel-transport protein
VPSLAATYRHRGHHASRPAFINIFSGKRRSRHLLVLLPLLAANLLAWGWALSAFADHPAQLGTALLAYLLGLRHAVDADHIAAIDNTVRKLMQENQRPLCVGFFFSVGHSMLVIAAVAAVVFATRALQDQINGFREIGGAISTGVSAFFCWRWPR